MTNHENTRDTTNLPVVLGGTGKSIRRVAERRQAHGVPVYARVTTATGVWSA
jgi:hypothetical protein